MLHLLCTQGRWLWGDPSCIVCIALICLAFSTNPHETKTGQGQGAAVEFEASLQGFDGGDLLPCQTCVKYIILLTQPHKSKEVSNK